jgi:DNA mismatch endonuclease (patch repair protein)
MALSRSEQMARIRSRGTKPEAVLRQLLWSRGYRYRLHVRVDGCRPDLVFKGARVLVFIDGCFWHGCPEHYVRPRSRDRFWRAKLLANVERDVRQTRELEQLGWRVCRIWEHEIFAEPEGAFWVVEEAVSGEHWEPRRSWRVDRVDPVPGEDDLERRHLRELRDRSSDRIDVRARSTRKWKTHGSLK